MNSNEPIFNAAMITAGIGIVIDLLLSYGFVITDNQQAAWRAAAAFVAPFIVWAIARRKTVTVDKANAAVTKAEQGKQVAPFNVGN